MYNVISSLLRYIFITIIYMFILNIIRMIYLDISRMHIPAKAALPTKFPYLLVLNQRSILPFDINEFYPLNKETMMAGRSVECDIVLGDMLLSKKHMRVWFEDREWHIEDWNSKNGTFINGERVDSTFLLDDGDIIKLGQIELQFCANK